MSMPPTTSYRHGDNVLVSLLFTNEAGRKRRPVLVLSTPAYHEGRQEVVVSAITGNTSRVLVGDYLMADWLNSGLMFPSVVTGIIRTIKQSMIERRIGSVSDRDMTAVEGNLQLILGLAL